MKLGESRIQNGPASEKSLWGILPDHNMVSSQGRQGRFKKDLESRDSRTKVEATEDLPGKMVNPDPLVIFHVFVEPPLKKDRSCIRIGFRNQDLTPFKVLQFEP